MKLMEAVLQEAPNILPYRAVVTLLADVFIDYQIILPKKSTIRMRF